HHIAVLRDNRSGTMALFLNGQPDQVLQGAPGIRLAPKEITIGAHSPKWAELHGRMADVRFYRRQLSVQEIAELTRRRGADR
ncbi:MAG TPA: LamG-like jellyroll fold domain-containing protein, partial [Planctomycetota bacterium]|nr:LamG-like jellyroll fold domain-containing protein [Planctomycetota bacterium]